MPFAALPKKNHRSSEVFYVIERGGSFNAQSGSGWFGALAPKD